MVNPYESPSLGSEAKLNVKLHQTEGDASAGRILGVLLLFIASTIPTLLGSIWIFRFLVWHKVFGLTVNREHHWLLLTILGLGLVAVFGPGMILSGKYIARSVFRRRIAATYKATVQKYQSPSESTGEDGP